MRIPGQALLRKPSGAIVALLYFCATLQFVRFYCQKTTFYLNMGSYLSGHERLPFQERVLPILLIRPLVHSTWLARHLVHRDGIYTAERGPLYIVSLVALLAAGVFVQRLYDRISVDRTLRFLVYPMFLFAIMWSYSIHNEADFSYPYDMLSVAFFAAGLYFIYVRRFLPLLAIMVLGTLNRETTLFLVGIFALDAASREGAVLEANGGATRLGRFSWRQVPWVRVALLACVWAAIKVAVARHFAGNDASEDYVRIAENVGRLKPRLWPALLNICGYMLPAVFLFRRFLAPARFANYLYIFPVWFAVMFYTGVIVETRIYGELCSFAAVSLVLIMERAVRRSAVRLDAEAGQAGDRETSAWARRNETAA